MSRRRTQEEEALRRAGDLPAASVSGPDPILLSHLNERTAVALLDIEEFGKELQEYLAEGEEQFSKDRKTWRSTTAVLDHIATIAHYLDETGFSKNLPDVDWTGLWQAHIAVSKAYHKTTPKVVWQTATEIAEEILPQFEDYFAPARHIVSKIDGNLNDVRDDGQAKSRKSRSQMKRDPNRPRE